MFDFVVLVVPTRRALRLLRGARAERRTGATLRHADAAAITAPLIAIVFAAFGDAAMPPG